MCEKTCRKTDYPSVAPQVHELESEEGTGPLEQDIALLSEVRLVLD